MKCVIYCRKSTDREDRQAISLEHQLGNCRRIAIRNRLEIIEEIVESRSAKKAGTRPGFEKLLSLCSKGRVGYVIVDEPKRLARNFIDSAHLLNLLIESKILGMYAGERFYRPNDTGDAFMLHMELGISTKENQDRSKDTKAKMLTCLRTQGRLMARAPM